MQWAKLRKLAAQRTLLLKMTIQRESLDKSAAQLEKRLVEIWQPQRPLLIVALLGALAIHGGLALYGSYANTYDAYIHIFFADHWQRAWFDPWEPRWYTGFTMTSYPPLSHQSVALLAFVTGGLRTAFVCVQTAALLGLTVGMYRFARLWVDEEAAQWAALWLVLASALAETVHVFGQLPTVVSLCFLLNALPYVYRWVRSGRYRDLIRGWALIGATTGAHHVTTLFGAVFIMAPVILLALLQQWHTPLPGESLAPARYWTGRSWRALSAYHLRRVLAPGIRTALFGVGAVTLLLVVVWPYWAWSRLDPISQVPIPHASRDNYLVNLNAGLIFWLIPYGMLIPLMPYIFYKGLFGRTWPLTLSIALLALLGTGGTTPIPRLLLGGAFDILTLDRYTLWAAMLMLPLAGRFTVSLNRGVVGEWLQWQFGRTTWHGVQLVLAGGVIAFFIFTVSLPQFRRFQPQPIDTQPIVNFLQKDQHWRWRFLTLGFGDQMAWLSTQTTATQVDGNYHSARRLPEMTTTSVERLEGAKFRGIPGIGSLQQFLVAPEKYHLKYIFSNDTFYDPLLFFTGWHRIGKLENDIMVWEREDIPVLPTTLPRKEIPFYQRLMFGTLPLAALVAALVTTTGDYWLLPLRVLAELAGAKGALAARTTRFRGVGRRWWGWLDNHLLAIVQRQPVNVEAPEPPWQAWLRARWPQPAHAPKLINSQSRRRQTMILLLPLLFAILLATFWRLWYQQTPRYIITAYYDDIDFKRFEAAYARLNPATRPPLETFMLNLSVQGGLLSSYSKLDTFKTSTLAAEANHQEMVVTTRYITALSYYTDTIALGLTRTGGQWTIELPPVDSTVPPDQFLRKAEVDWLTQGRRQVTVGNTNFLDAIDRPNLAVLSTRLVQRTGGAYSLVGELLNNDVDPADITVTGTILDAKGELLTWYNAGEIIIHKLLPLEITPFRIDFEGVAGAALTDVAGLEFAPGAQWTYQLPSNRTIGRYEVTARAVVTQRDLDRGVSAQQLSVVPRSDGVLQLQGELINHDLRAATIPHLLVTYYDGQGKVLWVDHHYLPQAIRPQRTQSFNLLLTAAATLRTVAAPGTVYTNAMQETLTLATPRPDFIAAPAGYPYSHLRVSVNYFVEE